MVTRATELSPRPLGHAQREEMAAPPLFAFAGGGTGGHLYPAMAVAEALVDRLPDVQVVFYGTDRPIDARILGSSCPDKESGTLGAPRRRFALVPQRIARVSAAPWRWPRMLMSYGHAAANCRARFRAAPPAVVVGTGGLGSVPPVREAARLGIPTALLNPDAIPGRANRFLARHVRAVFAQWEVSIEKFPPSARVYVTGCPIRREFRSDYAPLANEREFAATEARDLGVARFDLDSRCRTLLITGASQGARTINEAALASLDFLGEQVGWQILHLAGEGEFEHVRAAYRRSTLPALVLPFTDDMALAMAAADLVVCRAGASTLAELTALGRPAVLMPYPFHRDNHQLANARCLEAMGKVPPVRVVVDRVDPVLNAPALRQVLGELMVEDRLRAAMAAAAAEAGHPDAADRVAEGLIELAGLPLSELAAPRRPQPCKILEVTR